MMIETRGVGTGGNPQRREQGTCLGPEDGSSCCCRSEAEHHPAGELELVQPVLAEPERVAEVAGVLVAEQGRPVARLRAHAERLAPTPRVTKGRSRASAPPKCGTAPPCNVRTSNENSSARPVSESATRPES